MEKEISLTQNQRVAFKKFSGLMDDLDSCINILDSVQRDNIFRNKILDEKRKKGK